MIFDELHADRPLDRACLAEAVAEALGAPIASVQVLGDLAEAEWWRATVVVLLRPVGGEFSERLGIYCAEGFTTERTPDDVAAELARRTGARIVGDDGTPNPYTAILFGPEGERLHVVLDASSLDDREEVSLSRPAARATPLPAPATRIERPADRLRALLASLPDLPIASRPTTADQWSSYAELHRLVVGLRPPVRPDDWRALRAAIARVRVTWPARETGQAGSTIRALLDGAALLLDQSPTVRRD